MNFDRLARYYDAMEFLCGGGLLQRARTAWLDELGGCRNLLSVGEGHGKFAAAYAARHPGTALTCVEASAAMIDVARRRPPATANVRWELADVLAWTGRDESYDAIATCFFLDCFPPAELAVVVKKLAALAAPGARWLVVDFALPPRGFAHWRARAVHALMYTFFRGAVGLPARRLTPPDDLLRGCGFVRTYTRAFSAGLIRADVWRRG